MKRILYIATRLIGLFFAIILSPLFIVLGWYFSYINRFSDITLILAYIPGNTGELLRLIFYKILLKGGVGNKTQFKFGSYCQYRDISIGSNCSIGTFNAIGLVSIGDDVLTGGNVNFISGVNQHGINNPNEKFRNQPGSRVRISIGSDVWIGSNTVVCANISDRVVVGAGSVVITDLPSHGVYAGNKATLIKKLDGRSYNTV